MNMYYFEPDQTCEVPDPCLESFSVTSMPNLLILEAQRQRERIQTQIVGLILEKLAD